MLNSNPSAVELFTATHSKVDENGQQSWCDGHAKSVYVSCLPIRSKYVNIVNMNTRMYTYISNDMCIYTYTYAYISDDMCVYICIYTYMMSMQVYMYIYTYIRVYIRK